MFAVTKTTKLNQARCGRLRLKSGVVTTPLFMPVATRGVLKYLSSDDLASLGYQLILANTYHLLLRPGPAAVKKYGGLPKFMGWSGGLLTDSGGFQIFSLAASRAGGDNLVKLTADGVEFKSPVDGQRHFLTPENVWDTQRAFGVDIAVCLDQCLALPAAPTAVAQAVALTGEWAERTKKYADRQRGAKPLLFAVIQGGLNRRLRQQSLAQLNVLNFDGYNIGGLSVGESPRQMYKVLDYLTPAMPVNKPRYLMGVGYPENIVEAVKRGVDMFDCVIPAREGRHGRLFRWAPDGHKKLADDLVSHRASQGRFYQRLNLRNAALSRRHTPVNSASKIPELQHLTLAYLHYLSKINEPLAARLATLNNLEFYHDLLRALNQGINNN